jgi:hypothetical protein
MPMGKPGKFEPFVSTFFWHIWTHNHVQLSVDLLAHDNFQEPHPLRDPKGPSLFFRSVRFGVVFPYTKIGDPKRGVFWLRFCDNFDLVPSRLCILSLLRD